MRKFLLSMLLATTAAAVTTPALAQRTDREDRAAAREERQSKRSEAQKERATEAREAKPKRAEKAPPEARPQRAAPQPRVEPRAEARDRARTQEAVPARRLARPDRAAPAERRPANVNERGRPTLDQRREALDSARDLRQDRREQLQQQRQVSRERYAGAVTPPRRVAPPPGARPDRPAPPPPQATTSRPAPTWHGTWRHDNRYDWRRHRDRNHSLFRLGIYLDPFGWGYRRWGVGWRLWPSYYSNSYWLGDPWMYRLPYAPWPYKWVRYYDDAILVNVYTGQVVDVIYEFFW